MEGKADDLLHAADNVPIADPARQMLLILCSLSGKILCENEIGICNDVSFLHTICQCNSFMQGKCHRINGKFCPLFNKICGADVRGVPACRPQR